MVIKDFRKSFPNLAKQSKTNTFQLTLFLLLFLTLSSCAGFKDKNKDNEINKDICSCHMGPPGVPGVPGVPGMHGDRGKDGLKGQKGEAGEDGKAGRKGEKGQDGIHGPPGEKGKRGSRGHKGTAGVEGSKGRPGVPGLKGEKGTSVDPSKQVAFSAVRSNKLGPVLQDTPVTFDRVLTNIGNSFELSSHFVCKINGTYFFSIHVLGQQKKDAFAWIMKNDKHLVPLHGDGRAGHGTGSNTVILHLSVNDHVWIQLSKDSALMNDYTTFSGFIIFQD